MGDDKVGLKPVLIFRAKVLQFLSILMISF